MKNLELTQYFNPFEEKNLPNALERNRNLESPDNAFEMFTEGDDLYKAMLSSIAIARRSVDLESYIFADDEIGWIFVEALAERARMGIRVRVHIDAAGSLFWVSRSIENFLKSNGVMLRWFHRWNWRQPWRYNHRNHRKVLIIDDEKAFLGGFNIHRENSFNVYGEKRWRDTHLSFKGPLVHTATQLFEAFWCGRRHWFPPIDASDSILVHNHTLTCRHRLRCIYSTAFALAQKYIYITTPYFVPDSHTLQKLREAAKRGVDVRLLVPRNSDMPIAQWAAGNVYAGLMATGVKIYEYLPRVLHAKTAVIDDTWSMVGTANMDYRSFFINYELNLLTQDVDLSSRLKRQYLTDLEVSELILPETWRGRTWKSRVLERMALIVKRWL